MNISFAMSSDHSSPRLLAATIVLLTLTTACRHEPAYPTLLVEADSAFVLGDYRCADSLLAAFDQQTVKTETGRRTDGAVLAYRQYLTLTRKYVRERLTDEDFSLADSLCRYYNKRGTRQKRGRSLLFLGDKNGSRKLDCSGFLWGRQFCSNSYANKTSDKVFS